jgi:hypothetical protein
VAAKEIEMRRAPGGDVLVVVAVGDRTADHKQKDLADSHSKCDTGYVRNRHGNEIQSPRS